MSGMLGVVGRFLQAVEEFAGQMYALDLYNDDGDDGNDGDGGDGGDDDAGPLAVQNGQGNQAQAGLAPVGQPVPAQGGQAPVVIADPTLAERLAAQRTEIAAMETVLSRAIWRLAPQDPAVVERADTIEAWVGNQRAVPGAGSDADADQRLIELVLLVAATKAIATRHANRIKTVHKLYTDHPGLPGIPAEADQILRPLLCTEPPSEATLIANLRTLEASFAALLGAGFDAAADAEKPARFASMWKLGAVTPVPKNGVGEIYVSSFDGPADQFGVSWNLSGLPGWVLHGHARLVWDDREERVVIVELPRLHIKPEAGAHGQGGTIAIGDDTVVGDLQRRSLKHVQKLATNRHYAEVFARTKFKHRQ